MLTREVIDAWTLIDRPDAGGPVVREFFQAQFPDSPALWPESTTLTHNSYSTDVLEWMIPGRNGKSAGGTAPTLAVVGRLGGVGLRPDKEGTVSDADGAVVALATAIKLARAHVLGDTSSGDVIVVTQICPAAPTREFPVRGQMDSPVPVHDLLSRFESPAQADALISVDSTRSHYLLNHTGIAVTPPLVNGVIMRISPDLMKLVAEVTSEPPVAVPITMQDITPMNNGLFRINSIMQPGNYFHGPVVGLASVSRHPITGSTTAGSRPENMENAARLCVEAARRFGRGDLSFYDQAEYKKFTDHYGDFGFLVGRSREDADLDAAGATSR